MGQNKAKESSPRTCGIEDCYDGEAAFSARFHGVSFVMLGLCAVMVLVQTEFTAQLAVGVLQAVVTLEVVTLSMLLVLSFATFYFGTPLMRERWLNKHLCYHFVMICLVFGLMWYRTPT